MGEDPLEDIAQAIESSDATLNDKLAKVGEGSLDELLRRFDDPEERKKLAATGLLQLANAYLKHQEKLIDARTGASNAVENAVDVIMDSKLPPDRKRALLESTLTLHENEGQRIMNILKGEIRDE